MKKYIAMMLAACAIAVLATPALAVAVPYSFALEAPVITVDNSITVEGKTWYRWTYKVKVVEPEVGEELVRDRGAGLSHYTLGLDNCWLDIDNELIKKAIEDSIGYDGDDPDGSGEYRTYDIEFAEFGNAADPDGIKWDYTGAEEDQLDNSYKVNDVFAEYDFFWFSVPTNQAITTTALLKFGQNFKYVDALTPDCPDCPEPPDEVIPEPATMLLFGSGMFGLLGLYKRKRS